MIGSEFPYLVGNVVAFPMLAAAWLAAGPQRRAMVASGVLCAPLGALSLIMGDYWSPRRLWGAPLGIEDFLFSFQAGASAWFWGSLPFRHRLTADLRWRPLLERAGLVSAGFIAGVVALSACGLTSAPMVFVASLAIVGIAIAWRPRLWRLALATACNFTASYVVLLWVLFALLPGLTMEWPAGPQLTSTFLGVPIGEYAWAVFGATAHVLCFAYIAQADLAGPEGDGDAVTATNAKGPDG